MKENLNANLPSQSEVVNTLEVTSDVASDATIALSVGALVTSGTPAQPVLLGAAATTGAISVGADVSTALITREPADATKAITNGVLSVSGGKIAKTISNATGNTPLVKDTFKSAVDVMTGTITTAIEETNKQKDDKK